MDKQYCTRYRTLYHKLHSIAFVKEGIRNELFFSTDKQFYYTYINTFDKLFRLLVFKLNIIQPCLLQDSNQCGVERNKLVLMEQAILIGERMILENNEELFGGSPNKYMSHFFYIRKDCKDMFLNNILLPLLNLIISGDKCL
jgi:hypothetical protein